MLVVGVVLMKSPSSHNNLIMSKLCTSSKSTRSCLSSRKGNWLKASSCLHQMLILHILKVPISRLNQQASFSVWVVLYGDVAAGDWDALLLYLPAVFLPAVSCVGVSTGAGRVSVCPPVALDSGLGLLCSLLRQGRQVPAGVLVLTEWLLGEEELPDQESSEELSSLVRTKIFL